MFSYASSNSISRATVTPSFVTSGLPKPFSRTTTRPEGPRVTLTAWASLRMPARMRSRASVLKAMDLAAMWGFLFLRGLFLRYLRPMRIQATRSASMMKTDFPSVTLTRWSGSSGMSMAEWTTTCSAAPTRENVAARSPLSSRRAARSWSGVMRAAVGLWLLAVGMTDFWPTAKSQQPRAPSSVDHGQDVVLGHDEEFLVVEVEFDLGAGVGGEDDAVALLDGEGDALAGVGVEGAVADGLDGPGLGLLLAGLGEVDPRVGLALGLVALDEDLVAQGADGGFGCGRGLRHRLSPKGLRSPRRVHHREHKEHRAEGPQMNTDGPRWERQKGREARPPRLAAGPGQAVLPLSFICAHLCHLWLLFSAFSV